MEAQANKPAENILITSLKLFFFGGFGMAILLSPLVGFNSMLSFIESGVFNGLLWVGLWIGNGVIADMWRSTFPWTKEPVKRFVLTLSSSLIYTVFIFFIISYGFSYYKFGTDLATFVQQLNVAFFTSVIVITMLIGLFMHGRSFLDSWRETEIEAERLKVENLSSKYETLKNQVNPHFLFNSLNVLSNLVYKDQDMAAHFIKEMSKVYRYVLDTKDKEVVSLTTELDALKAYIYLCKIRFGENLNVDINLTNQDQIMVAPLTLQMLVENAIKHNVISKAKPLSIQLFQDEKGFIIVKNNKQSKRTPVASSGIGIPNIQARYRYISQKDISIIDSNDYFTVKIPIVQFEKV